MLDPMVHRFDPDETADAFKALAYVLPHTLEQVGYYDRKPGGRPDDTDWIVHVANKSVLPLQTDGYDISYFPMSYAVLSQACTRSNLVLIASTLKTYSEDNPTGHYPKTRNGRS